MNTNRSNLLRMALRTLAISATPVAVHAQNIISINLGANEGSGSIASSTVTAGAVPVAGTFWNNMSGATQAVPQPLINNAGASSGASVTWSSANTWRSGSTGGTATSQNGILTKGYLDDSGAGAIVNVANVPYLAYDVYVIRGSDQGGATENANAAYRPVSVNGINHQGNLVLGTVSTSTIVGGLQTTGFNWTNDDVLLNGRNYHYAPGKAGLTLSVRGNTGASRGPIAGLQIVDTYAGTLRYWDIDGATAGAGGAAPSGTWNNAATNWNNNGGTGAAVAWTGTNEAAVFSAGTGATGSYTVTVSGTQNADAVILEEGNLTLSGGTVNLVNAGIVRAFTGGGTLTVNSNITSTGTVTFEGAGSIALNGTASHTGATNISSSFNLGATGSIPSTASLNLGTGITAIVDGSITTSGQINLSGSAILGGGTLVAGGDVNLNNLGTTNNLTLAGGGSLTANTGSFLLNRGTVNLSGNAALNVRDFYNRTGGITTDLNVSDSATVSVTGFMVLGDNTSAAMVVNQSGGSVTNTGTTDNPGGNSLSNRWGHWGTGATTVYNLSGGSLNLTGAPLYLSWDSAATLNVGGTGIANLKGVNMGHGTHDQPSTINLNAGGKLNIGSAGIITGGTTAKVVNLNGGTLGASADWTGSVSMPVLANSVIDSTGGNISLNGPLTGAGGLTIQGGKTVALGGINTYGGATTVTGNTKLLFGLGGTTSTITINSGSSFGAGTFAAPGVGVANNVIASTGASSSFRVSDLASDKLDLLDLNVGTGHTLTVSPSGNIVPNSVFTVIDYATLSGTGYAGISVVSSTPRLSVTKEPNNGSSIDVKVGGFDSIVWKGTDGINPNLWDLNTTQNWLTTFTNVGTKYLQNDVVIFDDTAATGNVTLAGSLLPASTTFNNSSLSYFLSGAGIGGTGGIVKDNTGTVELRNANTYTGATTVTAGILRIGDGASGTINPASTVTVDGELQLNLAAGSTYANATTFTGTLKVIGSGDMTFNPTITNLSTGPLIFDRAGTVLCTSSNQTAGSVTIQSGTVTYDGNQTPNRLPSNKLVTVNAGATMKIIGVNALPNHANSIDIALNGSALTVVTGTSPSTNDATSSHAHTRDITMNGGTVNLDYAGTGTTYNDESFQLNGNITVTGSSPSAINSGAGTNAVNSGIALQGARTFNVEDVTLSSAADLVVTAQLEDSDAPGGSLTKSGPGTLQFAANIVHTYTGATIVDTGTLVASGSVAGALQVNAAGTIAPGASAGSFAAGATVLTGTYACELDGVNGDSLAVTGGIDLTGSTLAISVLGGGATKPTYVIASYTGTRTGTFATVTGLPSGYSVNYNDALSRIEITNGADVYGSWETANGIAGAGAEVDSDNDGIDNGIEFVIGGDPSGPGSDSSALLPTVIVDATYLNFTFRRTDDSASYDPVVEYGSNLTGWADAEAGVNGVVINETNDGFGTGIDRVEVKIPRSLAVGAKFFARLKITIVP